MKNKTGVKVRYTRRFLRTMLAARTIRAKQVNIPFQIGVDDILTGYMGEAMHRELFLLKKAKKL